LPTFAEYIVDWAQFPVAKPACPHIATAFAEIAEDAVLEFAPDVCLDQKWSVRMVLEIGRVVIGQVSEQIFG